jgi:hypothetical protein
VKYLREILSRLSNSLTFRRLALGVFFVGLVTWVIVGLIQVITSTPQSMGARDFHSYWYYGQFLRQGSNPYQAFIENRKPNLPIYFIDGEIIDTEPVAQPQLPAVPANTAPMVLVLSIFSWFSWPVAKIIWMFLNLVFLFLTSWLLLYLEPINTLARHYKVIIVLLFLALAPTRVVVSGGQTSLLVFLMMLTSLITASSIPIVSGLALGFALSKYSLALPVFLFLIYKRKYIPVLLALIFQLGGIIMLSILTKSSVNGILKGYLYIFQLHSWMEGIHLGAWLGNTETGMAISGFLSIIFLYFFWKITLHKKTFPPSVCCFADYHVLTVLSLWTLWVVYHRKYDAVLYIFFINLIIYGLSRTKIWNISSISRKGLWIFLIFSIGILSIPGGGGFENLLPSWLSQNWASLLNFSITVVLLAGTALTLFLYSRIIVQDMGNV